MPRKSDLTSVRAILSGEGAAPSGVSDVPAPRLREWWEVRSDPTLKAEADAVLEDLRQRRLAEENEAEAERLAA